MITGITIGHRIVYLRGILSLYIILIMGKCNYIMTRNQIRNHTDNIKTFFFN